MTDQQINHAIAEACGWTEIQTCTCCDDVFRGKPPGKIGLKHIEEYCTDLNAMHEAEKTLTNANMYVMEYHVKSMVKGHGFYFHITARQRAEAFLRTLGKWEEVQK